MDFLKEKGETCEDLKEVKVSLLQHSFNLHRACNDGFSSEELTGRFVVFKSYLNDAYRPGFFSNKEDDIVSQYGVSVQEAGAINYCAPETYDGALQRVFFQKMTIESPSPAIYQFLEYTLGLKPNLNFHYEPDVSGRFGQNFITIFKVNKTQGY